MKKFIRSLYHLNSILIKLTLIIGIVALIIGVIILIVHNIKGTVEYRASELECINKLRIWHRAYMMYREDYDGSIPEGYKTPAELGLPCHDYLLTEGRLPSLDYAHLHTSLLKPYLPEDPYIACCPDDPNAKPGLYLSYYDYYDFTSCGHSGYFVSLVFYCKEKLPLKSCVHHQKYRGEGYYIIMKWNGEVKGKYVTKIIDHCN